MSVYPIAIRLPLIAAHKNSLVVIKEITDALVEAFPFAMAKRFSSYLWLVFNIHMIIGSFIYYVCVWIFFFISNHFSMNTMLTFYLLF